MNYVIYNEEGNLTGAYWQDLHPSHADCYIEVSEAVRRDWLKYRANADRTDVELIPEVAPDLSAEKAKKLAVVKGEADKRMAVLVEDYPLREQQTFLKQEDEARAYIANPSAYTPLMDLIAEYREISKADLADRIIVKADLFVEACGPLIGYRQKLEDQIAAATTIGALDAIDPMTGWPE